MEKLLPNNSFGFLNPRSCRQF